MSITRAAEDASCWWSNHYPCHQLPPLPVVQPPYNQLQLQGGAHYFGHHKVVPQMIQLPFSRPRLRWSKELHDKFVSAVNQLGGATKATPKTISNVMQVEGLTLFQIKSHLQKYRLGKIGRRLRTDFVAADGRRNVENELPENEPMDMEGYNQGSCDISYMNGNGTLEAQKYGNLNHVVEELNPTERDQNRISSNSQTSVKNSEMTQNRPLLPVFPPITISSNHGDPHCFLEWSELLDGDGVKPVGYSSELSFTRTRDSSRPSRMFGSFFDEVARFPSIEDNFMMDYYDSNATNAPGL